MKKKSWYTGLDPSHYSMQADLVHCPLIKIVPYSFSDKMIQETLFHFYSFTHVIITSKSTINLLCHFLNRAHIPLHVWQQKQTIAVGQVTALNLKKMGIIPAFIAKNETAEGIIDILSTISFDQPHFFWPHSHLARPLIKIFLDEHHIKNHCCSFYTTEGCLPDPLPDLQHFKEIIFTSPSTVDAFLAIFGGFPAHLTLTSIGPVTNLYLKKTTNFFNLILNKFFL